MQEEIEERLTMREKVRMIAPFILLGNTLVFWALPIVTGMISSISKPIQLNLTMKKQVDFDTRINELKKDLQKTANRHARLLEHLRPDFPEAWTEAETEDKGCYQSALSFKD